jgi:hypothetical protein
MVGREIEGLIQGEVPGAVRATSPAPAKRHVPHAGKHRTTATTPRAPAPAPSVLLPALEDLADRFVAGSPRRGDAGLLDVLERCG